MSEITQLREAASIIVSRAPALVFTGAGISVESGIPPFRGNGGLWESVDPSFVEINYFFSHPERSWKQLKSLFYDNWGAAEPNNAHRAIVGLEKLGLVKTVVTQNIDCMHQRAGSSDVIEFHGTLEKLVCTECGRRFPAVATLLESSLPACTECGGLLKPDVVFFGEGIPEEAAGRAFDLADNTSCVLVVGTTGEVMPACMIPHNAARRGAKIIEVNIVPSEFTRSGLSNIFLCGKAGSVLPELVKECALLCRS